MGNGDSGPQDEHQGDGNATSSSPITQGNLTTEQFSVLTMMMESMTTTQKLVFIHSAGGTGKSTIVQRLFEELGKQGFSQANTCPTGVGASHLPQGRTFHSMFKKSMPALNAGNLIDDMKAELGGDKLKVVVVDEASMLASSFLVLLDCQLRAIYKPTCLFGGISILLLGDFVQLPVTIGRNLYAIMYGHVTAEDANARALFAEFHVVQLQQQMHASTCKIQQ